MRTTPEVFGARRRGYSFYHGVPTSSGEYGVNERAVYNARTHARTLWLPLRVVFAGGSSDSRN